MEVFGRFNATTSSHVLHMFNYIYRESQWILFFAMHLQGDKAVAASITVSCCTVKYIQQFVFVDGIWLTAVPRTYGLWLLMFAFKRCRPLLQVLLLKDLWWSFIFTHTLNLVNVWKHLLFTGWNEGMEQGSEPVDLITFKWHSGCCVHS